jgi:hypothetical protein
VKSTFAIPKAGEEPKLHEEQVPLVEADVFTGEAGLSAPIYESDYAPFKPRCDVILNGSAYAPGGLPAERVTVSLSVGKLRKQFDVVGNRMWNPGVFGAEATGPEPFTMMPISYDNAFGGVDNLSLDASKHEAFLSNPVGRGFFPNSKPEKIIGKLLPNTEELGNPIKSPAGSYRPMAYGPIGRGWQPRPKYAGTYDQNWIDNVFPFLPADFENLYYQCAPEDQQTEHLRGGEELSVVNLTPEGDLSFRLPTMQVPITFYFRNYQQKEVAAVCDTLVIEPDFARFTMLWRASLLLRKNIFEVSQVITGRMSPGWYRARALGKTYYRSLNELDRLRRSESDESEEELEEVEQSEA